MQRRTLNNDHDGDDEQTEALFELVNDGGSPLPTELDVYAMIGKLSSKSGPTYGC